MDTMETSVVSYDEWLASVPSFIHVPGDTILVDQVQRFTKFMVAPVGICDGKVILAKSAIIESIDELQSLDVNHVVIYQLIERQVLNAGIRYIFRYAEV